MHNHFICCPGDPLYDLIPIYLDVFRGDEVLFKHLLRSYRLPLSKASIHGAHSCKVPENEAKFKRLSYRAMYVHFVTLLYGFLRSIYIVVVVTTHYFYLVEIC